MNHLFLSTLHITRYLFCSSSSNPGQALHHRQPRQCIMALPQAASSPADNTLPSNTTLKVPDGYMLLPHGMGVVPALSSEQAETKDTTGTNVHGQTQSTASNDIPPNTILKYLRKRIPLKDQSPYQKKSKVPWRETPWPEQAAPSAEQCQQVYDILRTQHANGHLRFERPAKIPPPSLEVAGCGETQLLLDGLCRTVLSGATSMKNADKAIRDVVDFYGTTTKSTEVDGQIVTPVTNCIDWNKVRMGGAEQLKTVIRSGGLQEIGSKAIMNILDSTQRTNAVRTAAFKQEMATGEPANIPGSTTLTQAQKNMEVWMFDNDIISLEHLRALPIETAMNELVQFRGVGVKTAACVILFCLQEPCFAVDTHCFRMAQWLGWLPGDIQESSGREKAFAHLDLRIPDHLKYGLHQLFIEHGQTCHRCKAITRPGNKDWDASVCPLEHILNRNKPVKKDFKIMPNKAVGIDQQHSADEALRAPDEPSTDVAETVLNPEMSKDDQTATNAPADKAPQKPVHTTRGRKRKAHNSSQPAPTLKRLFRTSKRMQNEDNTPSLQRNQVDKHKPESPCINTSPPRTRARARKEALFEKGGSLI